MRLSVSPNKHAYLSGEMFKLRDDERARDGPLDQRKAGDIVLELLKSQLK